MTAPTLSKTTSVMRLIPSDNAVAEQQVTYVLDYDDTHQIYRTLILDYADFQELGSPEQVTVTIVPGDRLNG